ncbi:MAG: thioredoxin family protein [Bacteroidetes bacterium]|nr:thioredoxin family protein [Bacteroidota bacterium]
MKKFFSIFSLILCTYCATFAQTATWTFRAETSKTQPNVVDVFIDIVIPQGFHMYSFDQQDGGPLASEIHFDALPKGVKKKGALTSVTKVQEHFDEVFGIPVRFFSGKCTWKQSFIINYIHLPIAHTITGTYSYQLCMDDGVCINPFPETFSITLPALAEKPTEKPTEKPAEIEQTIEPIDATNTVIAIDTITENIHKTEIIETETADTNDTLWWIFIAGFIGGLLAFFTPCVFPMVPLTVSIFMKQKKEHAKSNIALYGLSIVVIYVALGLLITVIFGVDALNQLSTSPLFNVLFFLLFLLFALSFFGAFELVLPSSWINAIDKKSSQSTGILSVFFMAFTLVLVSFSCTAMIIGTLLVKSVTLGSLLGPFMGMLGFAIALALPFMLFAIFPNIIKSLPKSGSWLNSVKVVLGFIELALALKFLSNADLVAGWGILPRELFLAFWIVLVFLLGMYFLGKIRFWGDGEQTHVSIPRFMLALASFTFALYLIPGLFGAPLKALSGYLPPAQTQVFDLYTPTLQKGTTTYTPAEQTQSRKYADVFSCPLNLDCFFDYEEGLAYAQKVNKPVLLDFTGKACANCRLLEMNVWSDPAVLRLISQEYVLISLYVDSRAKLDPSLRRTEEYGGKKYSINTVGEHWSMFMMQNFGGLMQPYHVILSPTGNVLVEGIAYDKAKSIPYYKEFLERGLRKFRESKEHK